MFKFIMSLIWLTVCIAFAHADCITDLQRHMWNLDLKADEIYRARLDCIEKLDQDWESKTTHEVTDLDVYTRALYECGRAYHEISIQMQREAVDGKIACNRSK